MSRYDLNQILIASPCTMLWSQMKGDDRTRHCSACQLNVYNVAGLTRAETEELLFKATNGERVCVRLLRRADGTVITKDCPVGVELLRRARMKIAAVRFSLISALMGLLWIGVSRPVHAADVAMGKVAVAVPTTGILGQVAPIVEPPKESQQYPEPSPEQYPYSPEPSDRDKDEPYE